MVGAGGGSESATLEENLDAKSSLEDLGSVTLVRLLLTMIYFLRSAFSSK